MGLRYGIYFMNDFRKIQTGDWVGSAWGSSPRLTPYAQAIADHYPIQVPWFYTLNVNMADPLPLPRFTQVTRPYQYDVLILGANALLTETNTDNGNFMYLNITHQESGIPWAIPNRIGFFPLPSFAGIQLGTPAAQNLIMPILKLPEAFFWPAHTLLKLDWTVLFMAAGVNTAATLTLVGVQLINPRPGFKAPQKITMPDGAEITVGSRLPWFATVPMGEYLSRNLADFSLDPGEQIAQFLPPQDCNIEVHDAYGNFISLGVGPPELITVKLTDMWSRTSWTPNPSPTTAIFGGENNQVEPAMPFNKPYLLRKGHRQQITMQSNPTLDTLSRGSVTFRGVRLCEY